MGGSCFKAGDAQDDIPKQSNKGIQKLPENVRTDEKDKAMVEIKSRLRTLKDYLKKLEVQEKQLDQKVKDMIKEGKKDRAIFPLKHKKLVA